MSEQKIQVSIDDPGVLRHLKDDPQFESAELFRASPRDHKFAVGQVCVLVGLQDFPEFNGEEVKITAIRDDGSRGKAYYIRGRINDFVNWVYEYRLSPVEPA